MNKKQLIVVWGKKIVAFVLDLAILIAVYYVVVGIILLGIGYSLGKQIALRFESIFDAPFKFFLLIWYFVFLPKIIGNTFGRKILRIQDKFNLFWTWPFLRRLDDFPKKHFKKDVILKVAPKNGRWACPSCNEANLEAHDVCSECGQEIEK